MTRLTEEQIREIEARRFEHVCPAATHTTDACRSETIVRLSPVERDALCAMARKSLRLDARVAHACWLLGDWFETVNQKITDSETRPPSYADLFVDVQKGLRHVGYLLELLVR